ncbi:hypothetical protein [Acidicapsa acidisoli]|uniref:hypothetical protein n=1 Tax=Acidicapsa acidisoli TaxID=1615681 RepID=UPI0021DF4E9D|nr:hypothetical protein [Acidicapsa acidisoli]
MSAKAEEFATQLLEKTRDGKLKWYFVADPELETYKSDAEGGISFIIKRKTFGENKVLTFELTEPGRVVLSDMESNFPISSDLRRVLEEGRTILERFGLQQEPIDDYKITRFRLYSDLFYAARETAQGGDQAIEKAQQFLARLA